jgi:hypothetical protein
LKQGFWEKIYIYIRGLHSVQSGVLPVYYSGQFTPSFNKVCYTLRLQGNLLSLAIQNKNIKTNISHPLHSREKNITLIFLSFFLKEIKELPSA